MIKNKYYENIERLREKIRDNTITALELESDDFQITIGSFQPTNGCYFCKKPINGKMRLLIDKYDIRGAEAEDRRPIHEACYHQAKLYFYFNGIPFSFN